MHFQEVPQVVLHAPQSQLNALLLRRVVDILEGTEVLAEGRLRDILPCPEVRRRGELQARALAFDGRENDVLSPRQEVACRSPRGP